MDLDLLLFFSLAVVTIASALAMLLARNPVYSAVFLILNLSTIAVFYLLLFAPFIALVQIAVYAGAIMVLFLFVIMLLGAEHTESANQLPWQKPLAIFLGVLLLAEISFLYASRATGIPEAPTPPLGFGSPSEIGLLLFTDYLLPFQITGILLLVAMTGAIVVTLKERVHRRKIELDQRLPTPTAGPSTNGHGERVVEEASPAGGSGGAAAYPAPRRD